MNRILTEVPESTTQVKKGWACPVCGTINSPESKKCANECVASESSKKTDDRKVLLG